jgi:hypothetical protein
MTHSKTDRSLQEGNTHPSSWHMIKRVLGVPTPTDIAHHVCVNDCSLFPDIKSSKGALLTFLPLPFAYPIHGAHAGQYAQHGGEVCSVCKQLRFETKVVSGRKVYVPRKVFWYLGTKNVIRNFMFGNKEWSSLRGQGREDPLQYYTSREAKRLDKAVAGMPSSLANSAYEMGGDWGQVFVNKSHSTGVIALR